MSAQPPPMDGRLPLSGTHRRSAQCSPAAVPAQPALATLALSLAYGWCGHPSGTPCPARRLPAGRLGPHSSGLSSRAVSGGPPSLWDRGCAELFAPLHRLGSLQTTPPALGDGGRRAAHGSCPLALAPAAERPGLWFPESVVHQKAYKNADSRALLSCIDSELVGESAFLSQGVQTQWPVDQASTLCLGMKAFTLLCLSHWS